MSAQRPNRGSTLVTTPNPYVEDDFAPVAVELTVFDLPVTGKVPEFLDGRYVRNGPNPFLPCPPHHHWFLGEGMVHGVRIRDGKALWYRNRWIRSRQVAVRLGEDRPRGATHVGLDYAPNTHVISHAGRTLALVEAGPRPYELTDELETIGPHDFNGTLTGGFTAHPKRDPVTGELHALTYFWGDGSTIHYTVIDSSGHVRRRVPIDVPGSPLLHDFALDRALRRDLRPARDL